LGDHPVEGIKDVLSIALLRNIVVNREANPIYINREKLYRLKILKN